MSSALQWMIVRNNSSFLLKGSGQTLTKEPNNLKGKNSFRYNGLIHNKTVGIEATADKKGVVLVTKKQTGRQRPVKSYNRVTFQAAAGPRRVLSKIRTTLRKNKYRKDLKMAALRRASALLRKPKTAPAAATTEKKGAKKADK